MKIIDNKKIDLTEDEWAIYQNIVKSYSFGNNNGADLFCDLFETDENGIIKFLKPPSKRQTSYEIFMFLISIFTHQHMREIYKQVDDLAAQIKQKMQQIDDKLNQK